MNESKINELLLKKNIELLRLYKDEESAKIKQIFTNMNNCIGCYKTSNTSSIVRSINSLISNASVITSNREGYCKTVESVITRYNNTARKVVSDLKKAGGSLDVRRE